MSNLKKALAVFICAVMIAGVMPAMSVGAASYSGTCGDNVTWTLDTSTGLMTISGTGDMDDYLWSSEVPWRSYRDYVKTVVIESGVTSIAGCAFIYCYYLTSVTIPEGVTTIGDYAFEYCTSLTSISLPESVTFIGEAAFIRCTALESLVIPDGVTSIERYLCCECESLTNVTIPNSVSSIETYAFAYCSSLTDVYYGGTKEEWSEIEIVSDSAILSRTRHYTYTLLIYIGETAVLECGTSSGTELSYECSDESVAVVDGDVVTPVGEGEAVITAESGNEIFVVYVTVKEPIRVESIVLSESGLTIPAGETAEILAEVLPSDAAYPTVTWESSNESVATVLDGVVTGVAIGEAVITATADGVFVTCEVVVSAAVAVRGTCGDDLTWTLDEAGLLTISGTGDMTNYTSYSNVPWYSYRASITSVVISDGVTSIGKYAFYGCTSFTRIAIPDSVTSIGDYAFEGCSLASITIPNGVTSIGSTAFRYCSNLMSITIPNSVTSIGAYAFYACSSLTSITIPDSVTSIGIRTFCACSSLTSITIPNSVTSIGNYAFEDCISLTSVTIPNSVTSIGTYAFNNCSSLTSITLPDSLTSISNYTFNKCYRLTSITIPNSVTSIGNYAFNKCYRLTNITIPDSVTSIGACAFESCTHLVNITIPDSVTIIGNYAFEDCTSLTSVTIPNSVTSIGDYAFNNCESLASITIPDNVISIGKYAFYDTAYYDDSSNWEDGGLYIGKHLISVKPSVAGNYTIKGGTLTVSSSSFSYCSRLTSVSIPNSVQSIGASAFYNCSSLTSVIIANSVQSISNGAFYGCNLLSDVYYSGTEEEWENIAIGSSNTYLTDATIHYNCVNVESVTLDISSLTLNVGETKVLEATVEPDDATITSITWKSSDESVATVEDGVVTAVSAGEATITVTTSDGGYTAECVVTVIVSVTTVTLDKTSVTIEKGKTETLTAMLSPSDATDSGITWTSSDESVATVENGVVTAISAGEAVVTVATSDGGYTAECAVTVIVPVESVTLDKTNVTIEKGKTEVLAAEVLPSDATNVDVVWTSSDESVATVENGVVTAISAGEAVISVVTSDGGYLAECVVTVIVSVESVTLDKASVTIDKGKAETLIAMIAPSDSTNSDITWTSSDENVATVADGVVTAVSAGEAVITVTTSDGGYTVECAVVVVVPVESVTLDKTSVTIEKGKTETLTATILPSDATDSGVTWTSSDESVATVENGVVTAVSAGEAVITVTTSDGGYTAECVVVVIVPVESVTLDKVSVTIERGKTEVLAAAVLPSDATNSDVTWTSSDESVATVENGVVTAVSAGEAVITVTTSDGGYTVECVVVVIVPVESVTLDKASVTIEKGKNETLAAAVSPSDATDSDVTWSSSDESVATVENGVVTAVSAGEAVITVMTNDGGYTAECAVTVVVPVESVSPDKTEMTIEVGEKAALAVTIVPDDATSKSIIWSSSNEDVVSVSSSGEVVGMASGAAIVMARTENGLTAQCVVTVKSVTTGITMSESEISLYVGNVYRLSAVLEPNDSTSGIEWSASNDCVAVANDGTVTAVSAGEAIVTAVSNGCSAMCVVIVENENIVVTGVSFEESEIIMQEGTTRLLTAEIAPENATDMSLTWSSSDESVAKVNSAGMVTAVSEGSAVIRAEAANGIYDECVISVVSPFGAAIVLTGEKALRGETAIVTASVANNPGISAYKFTIKYDSAVLTPTGVSCDEEFGGTFTTNLADADAGSFNVLWYSEEDAAIDGELFKVEFYVNDEAEYGTLSNVTIEYSVGDICNVKGESVALYIKDTAIDISEPLPGDIYEDGEVKVYDLTLLARYVTRLETLTERQLSAADVTGDGKVDIKDVIRLAKYIVGYSDVTLMDTAESNDAKAEITLGTAVVNSDGEAYVPVYISNNSGIAGFEFELDYDSDEIEILEITASENLPNSSNLQSNLGSENGNLLRVTWYQTADFAEDGELFVIKVKLKEGNLAEMKIVSESAMMCDIDENDVAAEYNAGYVVAESFETIDSASNDSITIDIYADSTFAGKSAVVVLQLLNGKNEQIKVIVRSVDLKMGKTSCEFELGGAEYASYKYFIWESMESMIPICDAVEVK